MPLPLLSIIKIPFTLAQEFPVLLSLSNNRVNLTLMEDSPGHTSNHHTEERGGYSYAPDTDGDRVLNMRKRPAFFELGIYHFTLSGVDKPFTTLSIIRTNRHALARSFIGY